MKTPEASSQTDTDLADRWRQLAGLAVAVLLAMSLWFSASAVATQLEDVWRLSSANKAWLTLSVQLGFVTGTLVSALFNLADRYPVNRLMAICAIFGAVCNGLIALAIPNQFASSASGFLLVLGLRFLTGAALAGVYPPGMKLMASWFRSGRGLAIGIIVGALTVGSASPHLLSAPLERWSSEFMGLEPWRVVLTIASLSALLAGLTAMFLLRPGPLLGQASRFSWTYGLDMWRNEAIRRANFGYLGHMWELYAMWTLAPAFIASSYAAAQWSNELARSVGFLVVAIGGVGCVVAGRLSDQLGRTTVTIASLLVSGSCAAFVGFLHDMPAIATAVCLLWGFAVVADSAQFSTAVTELCDSQHVGTALTVQTCAGFLLTTVTIRLTPYLQETRLGWGPALGLLALGPAFGAWHMWRLRRMKEAGQLAGGNR